MEELRIGDKKTEDLFVGFFAEGNIIPVIGAGFTCGEMARNNESVPDGGTFKQYMIDQILDEQNEFAESELQKESFGSVAEMFEDQFPNPKEAGITQYFYNHFTGVKIKNIHKIKFLNEIEWSHVYTLNIDTGIEESDKGKWEVFYPNKDFDDGLSYSGKRKIYKIHGDANRFIKTMDYNEMILSESQYIQSLDKNIKFNNMLSADCENKNIMYLGCSLDDEIDLKYSVLSDRNRNYIEKETMRIYVTHEHISALKKKKLEGYNVSNYICLQSCEDYDLFYDFMCQCYSKAKTSLMQSIDYLKYQKPDLLSDDLNDNITYLADIKKDKMVLPYYYFDSTLVKNISFNTEKINVIMGRRFVGKTMLAYSILEHYQTYNRFFVMEQESVDQQTIRDLMGLKKSLIVFDSDAVDDRDFVEIVNSFKPDNGNIICVFVNTYDDILNVVSNYNDMVFFPVDHTLVGKMNQNDLNVLNKKLDKIGITNFKNTQNILDNTLRIANVYGLNVISDYEIIEDADLEVVIWCLVHNKMYFEDIVTLGLGKKYREVVDRLSPFLQIEKCKKSERSKHSSIKIVCNGKIGLLQLLNNYAYPIDDDMGRVVAKNRHSSICRNIYRILSLLEKTDNRLAKKFIMFDTLNDIFSRKYSRRSINYLASNGKTGRMSHGAAGLIQMIYSDGEIQRLKASDPNYWLQRAKSIYIANRYKMDLKKMKEGINYAIKAEQDSIIRIEKGHNHFYRTMSNATIQIAMMYGKVAHYQKYRSINDNNKAVEYYYKGLSDANNIAAAKSLINHSKGTADFNNLVNDIITNPNHYGEELNKEKSCLVDCVIKRTLD